jgi:hypothetical protein
LIVLHTGAALTPGTHTAVRVPEVRLKPSWQTVVQASPLRQVKFFALAGKVGLPVQVGVPAGVLQGSSVDSSRIQQATLSVYKKYNRYKFIGRHSISLQCCT